jgi:fructose-1,6-bisphosphatase/inositol monophosphatase family enzyme
LDDIEFGIVKNISNGDMFIAEKGHGAYLNNKSFAIPDVPPKEILSALTLGKNCDPLTLTLAEKDLVRSLGAASLEMCLVAIGALDFYIVGREYLRVTDIAASTLIVREAGGTVTNIAGEEIDLPLSLDERTSVITAGSKNIVEYIIAQGKT